jgi:lipoprotein-anchoring transpeptidase ErfK/SrfK
MRRICMSALVPAMAAGVLSSSAFADPLQMTFSPYAMAQPAQQPVYVVQQQPVMAPQVMTQQVMTPQYAGQQYYAVAPQGYVQQQQPVYVQQAPRPYVQAPPAYTGSVQAPVTYAVAQPSPPPQAAPPAVTYAAAPPAPPPPQPAPPSSSGRGFLESIFGGPTIQAHTYSSYQPAQPEYQTAPVPQPTVVSAPAAYAPSSQGDMSSYPIDPRYNRQIVAYDTAEKPGTIVIDTPNKFLYLVEAGGKAMRYGIGVGRPGFTWAGVKTITAKKEWPDWRPPADMLARRPDLPRYMPGGMDNPLGARAMYLGSTLYRIHGSNEPWTIGTNVSSGCIRMRNEDVEDLYSRVAVGTKVVVI